MKARLVTRITLALACLVAIGCGDDAMAPDAAGPLEAGGPPLAGVHTLVPDLTGTWTGLVSRPGDEVRIMQPDDEEEELPGLLIDLQQGRRLFGKMQLDGGEFDVAGTISASSILSMVGDGIGTTPGATLGMYRLESFGGGGAALLGAIQMQRDGGVDTRGQVLLRQFDFDEGAGVDPPSVAGEWTGSFLSGIDGESKDDRHIVLEGVDTGPPTRFRGSLPFRGAYSAIPLEGSIDTNGNVVMVALAVAAMPCYIVVLEGQLIPEVHGVPCTDDVCHEPEPTEAARIVGTYRVLQIIGPNMIIVPNLVLSDFGTFNIIAILIG
jgi:hypothetical protein